MTTAMVINKAKTVTLILLAVTSPGGASVWTYRSLAANMLLPSEQSAEPPAVQEDDKPRAVSTKRKTIDAMRIQGRVYAPDGKARAGAKLLLLGKVKQLDELSITAADGRLSASVPKEATDRYLIAQTDDTGFDMLWTGSSRRSSYRVPCFQDQPY